jgi:hypothetical protein
MEYIRVTRNYRERLLRQWRKELGDDTLTFWEASDGISAARALSPRRRDDTAD